MICLVNPRTTNWKPRVPLSVLSIGASLDGFYEYVIADGNLDGDLFSTLPALVQERNLKYIGFSVMPGPQLTEAITLSKLLRRQFPSLKIIWGGYFPSLHTDVTLSAPYVDFVVRDQGDYAFKRLIDKLEQGGSLDDIPGLSFKEGGIHHNAKQPLIDLNNLPALPYQKVDMPRYIGRTYLGTRTVNYHSSVGCPFLCGFCAVAVSYRARWMGLTPEAIVRDLLWFKGQFGVNAVEFHDNNFFTSEARVREFSERVFGQDFSWWGEGRPDTLLQYDNRTWALMRDAGCKMIFMGAESGSTHVLSLMDKGGTQTGETILDLAHKMQSYRIVPEFSFVLGSPTGTLEQDIEDDIRFIKKIKRINPLSEIIIYVFSPVHFDEAELYRAAVDNHFAYPAKLDDWLRPEWRRHDLKKNPVTPWLSRKNILRIRNFEKVLNARHPTLSDLKLDRTKRAVLRALGQWRYSLSVYSLPLEVALAQRIFRYRQPEKEGF